MQLLFAVLFKQIAKLLSIRKREVLLLAQHAFEALAVYAPWRFSNITKPLYILNPADAARAE